MMGPNNRPYSRSQRGCPGTLDGGGKSWSALKTRRIPQAERRRKRTLGEEDRLIKGSLATEACVDACVHFLRLLEQMITNLVSKETGIHSFTLLEARIMTSAPGNQKQGVLIPPEDLKERLFLAFSCF